MVHRGSQQGLRFITWERLFSCIWRRMDKEDYVKRFKCSPEMHAVVQEFDDIWHLAIPLGSWLDSQMDVH